MCACLCVCAYIHTYVHKLSHTCVYICMFFVNALWAFECIALSSHMRTYVCMENAQ